MRGGRWSARGFGQVHPSDHIAYLSCHSDHARRGYATAILARLEARAISDQTTVLRVEARVEASCVARPFLEHFEYHVIEEEHPVRHGVEFRRFRMAKRLATMRRMSQNC